MSNPFEAFSQLPSELQDVAIREGEARLQAQLQTANAADQRALTWAGFLIAAATASLGGGVALIARSSPDYALFALAIAYAAGALMAAWFALMTVHPKDFSFPGNRPGNWLPSMWNCTGTDGEKIACAKCEQAQHIDTAIRENKIVADDHGADMRKSMTIGFFVTVCAGILLAAIVLTRAI